MKIFYRIGFSIQKVIIYKELSIKELSMLVI